MLYTLLTILNLFFRIRIKHEHFIVLIIFQALISDYISQNLTTLWGWYYHPYFSEQGNWGSGKTFARWKVTQCPWTQDSSWGAFPPETSLVPFWITSQLECCQKVAVAYSGACLGLKSWSDVKPPLFLVSSSQLAFSFFPSLESPSFLFLLLFHRSWTSPKKLFFSILDTFFGFITVL